MGDQNEGAPRGELSRWATGGAAMLSAGEDQVADPVVPGIGSRGIPANPDETVPFLLKDAIDLALQNSGVIRILSGTSVRVSNSTAYDPEIMAERWRAARAVFDPQISAGWVGSKIDEPPESFFGPGIPLNVKRDEGDFYATLTKPWQTGGTMSVGFLPPLAYLFYRDPSSSSGFNPVWAADLVFELRQPLLRGAGIAVNTAPIRITQLKANQSTWDVKDSLISELRSVEEAYWTLQAALATLQSYNTIMPLLDEAVRIEELRFRSEMVTRSDLSRTRLQRSQFQQQRVRAEADVRERELRLRQLIGLPTNDGRFLLPINPPIRKSPEINAQESLDIAIRNRPDLVQQRLNVEIRELELTVARNGRLPQLDFRVLHRASGLGDRLDDALAMMNSFQYTDWTGALTFSMPIGNRAPRAIARAAETQLIRERAMLRQATQMAEFDIADVLRELRASWAQYEAARDRVEDSREWVNIARIRFQNPPAAGSGQDWLMIALNDYQLALRSHVDAVTDAAKFLAAYNTWLARLEESQGTLLDSRRVRLENDPCRTVNEANDARKESQAGKESLSKPAADDPDIGWSLPPQPGDAEKKPDPGLDPDVLPPSIDSLPPDVRAWRRQFEPGNAGQKSVPGVNPDVDSLPPDVKAWRRQFEPGVPERKSDSGANPDVDSLPSDVQSWRRQFEPGNARRKSDPGVNQDIDSLPPEVKEWRRQFQQGNPERKSESGVEQDVDALPPEVNVWRRQFQPVLSPVPAGPRLVHPQSNDTGRPVDDVGWSPLR